MNGKLSTSSVRRAGRQESDDRERLGQAEVERKIESKMMP